MRPAIAKVKIRQQVGEVPFFNWFERTRQVERRGSQITIAVGHECERLFIESQYGEVTHSSLAELGIEQMHLVVQASSQPRAAWVGSEAR